MSFVIKMNFPFFLLFISFATFSFSQVCSPVGNLCTTTQDCCKGCCEAHSCVDRSFSCSGDLIAQPGFETCSRFYCPPEHICFLREVCPPENPCPRQASCRKVDFPSNNTSYRYYRNSSPTPTSVLFPLQAVVAFAVLLSTFAKFSTMG